MPIAAAAAAAGAGYLPLQANILAARLNISKWYNYEKFSYLSKVN